MSSKIGISGSVILSNLKLIERLFDFELDHIEIGMFKNRKDINDFYRSLNTSKLSYGIHSPVYQGESNCDFIESVNYSTEEAYINLEKDAMFSRDNKASYLLIHFPYFKGNKEYDENRMIENGLKRIAEIKNKYGINIVCEPKIGRNMAPAGIEYLNKFPLVIWEKYGIDLCIDIGDYVLAVGDKSIEYITKFKKFIKVVHLHSVEIKQENYYWNPIHPIDNKISNLRVNDIIRFLTELDNVYFVLEHTPHGDFSKEYVKEGIDWLKSIV